MSKIASELSAVFITDGLSHEDALARYKKRRDELKKQFRGPIVLRGVQKPVEYSRAWMQLDQLLIQDPLFLYLTGLNQYNCALLLQANEDDILFLGNKNLDDEFWDGKVISYDEHFARIILLLGVRLLNRSMSCLKLFVHVMNRR